MSDMDPRYLELVGRLHVLVVHFPIGLILAAGFIEYFGRGRTKPGARHSARLCLALGAVGAVLAAMTGWIHADHEPLSKALGTTVLLHRSTGIATALAAVFTWIVSRPLVTAGERPAHGQGRGYRMGLLAACALVTLTGHFGGTLVHGRGYLLKALWRESPETVEPEPEPVAARPEEASLDYARDVRPILAARCFECHGPKRSKGKLRLDRMHELLADPAQTLVVPGRPQESELVTRIALPADDLDIMPAEGEPLTADEVELIRGWVAQGAALPPVSEGTGAGETGAAQVE